MRMNNGDYHWEEDNGFSHSVGLCLPDPILYDSDIDGECEPVWKKSREEADTGVSIKEAECSEIEETTLVGPTVAPLDPREQTAEGTRRSISGERRICDRASEADRWEDALLEAVRQGDIARAGEAVAMGAEKWTELKDELSVLHVAVLESETGMLRHLLELRCDVDAPTALGTKKTALHVAAEAGMVATVALLVQYGACVDAKDASGRTPLDYAILAEDASAVTALLDSGADQGKCIQKIAGRCTDTMLSRVLEQTETWLYLDGEDENGMTPLMHAAKRENGQNCIRVLAAAGALVNRVSLKNGETALHVACEQGIVHNVRELVANGARTEGKDGRGETARELAYRVHGPQSDCIIFFVELMG